MRKHRHTIFFCAIVAFLAAFPFLRPQTEEGLAVLKLFTTGLLLAGVVTVSAHRRTAITAASLAVPGLLSGWLHDRFQSDVVFNLTLVSHIAFLAFVATGILRSILAERRVTTDLLFGALSVYLLIGVTWTLVYTLIEGLQADSFRFPDGDLHGAETRAHRLVCINSYLYYSFVSLLTIGFGDITPLTPLGRMLTIIEGMLGQFYLVILVSRLVGLQVSQEAGDGPSSRRER